MKHVRRSLMVVAASATALVASAGVALAQAYPPPPGPPGPGPNVVNVNPGAGGAGSGALPFTGSDLTLLWVGLVVLVVGLVFFVATRRRASLRRRGSLAEAAA